MADPALQTLLSSKAALDLGLITHEDYEIVKSSFLKAQQLKAAVDVGVLKGEDYERTKEQFLQLIAAAPAGSAVPSAPVAAAPRAAAPPPAALASPAAPAPGPPRPAPVTVPVAVAPTPAPTPSRPSSRPPSRPQTPSTNGVASPTKPVQQDVPISLPRIGGVRKASGTSMSGIAVSEDAVNLYYHIRSKSAYQWALWRIDDEGSNVIIAAVGSQGSTYSDFIGALPENDCRYGVYDYQEVTPEGQVLNKLVFLNWAPDVARVKSKMMYASTKDFFKGLLDGISVEFQASELDEVTEDEVAEAVRALKRS